MRMRVVLAVTALTLALALPDVAATADTLSEIEELSPPDIRWSRCAGILRVLVTAKPGAHLAAQLPLEVRLQAGEALELSWKEPVGPSDNRVKIRLPLGRIERPDQRQLSVKGAVCNDDASLCQPFHATTEFTIPGPMRGVVPAEAGETTELSPQRALPSLPSGLVPATGEEPGLPWFHSSKPGQVDAAFALAAKEERPLLVEVFARWCPPCNRLRDEFFEQDRWRPLLQRFVLVAADADATGSFALKERYDVSGYPTLLLLDPQGQPLDRIIGFPGAHEVATRLERIAPSGQVAQGGSAASLGEVRALTASGQWSEAWQQVEGLLTSRPDGEAERFELLALALDIAQHTVEDEVPRLAREAAEIAPRPGQAAALAGEAAAALRKRGAEEEAKTLIADFETRLSATITSRAPLELWIGADRKQLSGSLSPLDADTQRDLATAAWYRAEWSVGEAALRLYAEAAVRSAAQVLLSGEVQRGEAGGEHPALKIDLPGDLLGETMSPLLAQHQGSMHDLISALTAAQMQHPAMVLCQEMANLFPEDFTWHYRLAGLQQEAEGSRQAMAAARLAYHYSYGDNRLRAAGRLGEILYQQGNVDEARSLLERALVQEAPREDKVRTHRYRRRLQELLQTWHDEQRRTPR